MRAAQFLAIIGRGSKGSNALENTEDRAGATSEQQDNVINTVNSLDPYGPSWQLVPGNVAAGTVYAQVPTSGTGDLAFTRASTATRTDASGNIVNVASGVGRIHYRNADGSLSSTGRLLLEPQRTNSIRNSTMVGAVAGSPGTDPTNWTRASSGGLTRSVAAIGTENGLQYIDYRFVGTASSTASAFLLEASTAIAASNGQTWALSFYSKIVSGTSPSVSMHIIERAAAGVYVTEGASARTLTSSLAQYNYVRTLSGGVTVAFVQPGFYMNLVNGTAYDFTIRIAAPQMELGAYATTFIPTTTAAVTRLVDVFSRNNLFTNNIVTASGGTWFLDLSGNLSYTRDSIQGMFLGDSLILNSGNQFVIRSTGAIPVQIIVYKSGLPTVFQPTTTSNVKIAIKWNGTTADIFINGSKVVTGTSFTATQLQNFICNGGSTPFFINQSSLFPVPMTDAQCIQMTTL
jgi:hypothetical protein